MRMKVTDLERRLVEGARKTCRSLEDWDRLLKQVHAPDEVSSINLAEQEVVDTMVQGLRVGIDDPHRLRAGEALLAYFASTPKE